VEEFERERAREVVSVHRIPLGSETATQAMTFGFAMNLPKEGATPPAMNAAHRRSQLGVHP